MKIGYRLIPVLLFLALASSFTPVKKYVRKGKLSLERGDVKRAKTYFNKALELDSLNFGAHFGLGIMYSELLEDFPKALPHLEQAYSQPLKDTLYDLVYALAKSYHHNGRYEEALALYRQMQHSPDLEYEPDFRKDLKKRTEDCEYAMKHQNDPVPDNILVINAGRTLNTEMPEYVPVITPQQQIIFTSKRKDDEKEPINFMDGKYFESMYIADITPNGFTNLRRYTLPDQLLTPKLTRNHQAVVSLSQDGTRLFTFREGTIYEIAMDDRKSKKPEELVVTGDKKSYQNHAFLSRDGKTLYFTSDLKGGFGGNDIYKSVRKDDGSWSKPENLGDTINTPFDEDAPFLSADGSVLYFASKGHEGFGNFDIYKSEITGGTFSKPQNLGPPYNSPGHDIFLVTDSNSLNAYFSSGRVGGYGDMDIYKILDLDKFDRSCPESSILSLAVNDIDSTDHRNTVAAVFPDGYRVIEYAWNVNGEPVDGQPSSLDYDYRKAGTYTVSAKMMLICDSCLAPVMACSEIANTVSPQKGEEEEETDTTRVPLVLAGTLTGEQMQETGFDPRPVPFAFNKSRLGPRGTAILKKNAGALKAHPELKVELIGYTDARGDDHYNLMLSKRRARSVMNYLVRNGIDKSRILMVDGRGATEFVNDCGKGVKCPETEHRQNRRVTFILKIKVND